MTKFKIVIMEEIKTSNQIIKSADITIEGIADSNRGSKLIIVQHSYWYDPELRSTMDDE